MNLTAQEYKAIVENTPNMIWRAGVDAKCNYFNKRWLSFTGRTFEQECGDGWAEGVYPDDLDRCVKTYMDHFHKRTPFEMEYRLRRHDGEWRWINDRGTPFYTEEGEFAGYIGSCMDVTAKVEGTLYKELAQKDSLTGAMSRQYLISQLQQTFEAAKIQGSGLTIAMLDIDRFKRINDTYGHSTGDSALKLFASVVKRHIRENDLLGRYGGDEFVIVFQDASADDVNSITDRITGSLQKAALKTNSDEIILSMSFGLCELGSEETYKEMLYKADQNMYAQKKSKHQMDARED